MNDLHCEQQWGHTDDDESSVVCGKPATTERNGMRLCDNCADVHEHLVYQELLYSY
jgi:hypothetical protein